MRTGRLLGAAGLALLATAVGGAVLGLSEEKLTMALVVVIGLAGLAALAWSQGPKRRLFLALLFFLAPFNLSKAVVPPLDVFYSPGLYLTVAHMVLLVLLALWLWERLLVRRLPLHLSRLDKLALVYLGWIWWSVLSSPHLSLLTIASAVGYSLCVLAYYVVSYAIEGDDDVRAILRVLPWAFLIQFALVLAQMATRAYVTLPGAKVPTQVGTVSFGGQEAAAFRPIGAFDHPNALADYLTLLLAPALALVLMGPQRVSRRVWWVAMVVLGLGSAMLLATLSRGGWAAFLLAGLCVGLVYWRARVINATHLVVVVLSGVLAVGAIAVAYPQVVWRLTESDDRSTESRLVLGDQAATIIQAHPLTGVGFGQYSRAAHDHVPPSFAYISEDYQKQLLQLVVHNHYLLVAAELGVPAALFLLYLLVSMARQALPLRRWTDAGSFALATGLMAALVSQILFLAADNYYTDIRVFMLWMTAGLLQALTRLRPVPSALGLRRPLAEMSA